MTLYENYIVFCSILRKEMIRVNRIWIQTLIPPVVTVTLYFLIFGKFIGERIGLIHGVSYMQFIAPGLVMMTMITNSYMNVCSSFFSLKFQKSVEELLVSPARSVVIIGGWVAGGMYRALLVGSLVSIVSMFFAEIRIFSYTMLVLHALLTTCLFAQAGLINALFARKFDDINIVPTFVLTPLTYLGGVFYSIEELSPFWKTVSCFNPIVYMVNGFRYGFLGAADISLNYGLWILISMNFGCFFINLILFKKGYGLRS